MGPAAPTGTTNVVAVIGDPVRHSRSPAIHNAAFDAAGLDWVMVALPVRAGGAGAAVEGMRALGLRGMSVTMPHKADVIPALDDLDEAARRLGAVNCIGLEGDRLVGHNTDGAGFVASVREEGVEVTGARVVVCGAGGAARSVVSAVAGAGAESVTVANRSAARGEQAAALAGAVGRAVPPEGVAPAVAEADILVNATPLGMAEGDPLPVPADVLRPGLVVADLVYHPLRTVLLTEAAARGATPVGGLGMLVHQAAAAFEVWTGHPAPLEAMRRGATATG